MNGAEMNDEQLIERLRADLDGMVGDAGHSLPPHLPAAAPAMNGSPQRRWIAWGAAAATIVVLVGGLVVLANRDTGDDRQADVPPATTLPHPDTVPGTVPPDSTPPASAVAYEAISTVIDDGSDVRACPIVMESLPPQCGGGLGVDNWSWDAIDVEQSQNGITWVDGIYLRGAYDATAGRFVVDEARIPTDEERERLTGGPALDFSVPCPEPEGGWPARNQEWPGGEVAAIDGYAGAWIDESQQVMTVKFTGDLDAAEQAVREHYSDALCVVAAEHTEQELLAIQQTLMSMSSIQYAGAGVYVDATGEWVQADLATPVPADLQASFDAEFGAGVVRLSSPFHPVAGDAAPTPTTTVAEPETSTMRVEATGTVFQQGDASPTLCLGGAIDESLPPQCPEDVQPVLAGWSWDAIADEQTESDVTWGSAYVNGVYDPDTQTLAVEELRPPTDADFERYAATLNIADYSTPCEAPAGGWPASQQEWPGEQIAAIEGYAGAWSEAGAPMTVKFTGDLETARDRIEEYYADPVCLVPAQRSLAELTQILGEVRDGLLDRDEVSLNVIGVIVDASSEWVDVPTLAPMPELQAELDAAYGRGAVVLHPRMIEIGK